MSRRHKKIGLMPKPRLEPKLLRSIARGVVAGEAVKALGGTEQDIETAAKGVSRGWVKEVTIAGMDGAWCVREEVKLSFDEDDSGEIGIDLEDGKRCALEAMDGGLLRVIQYQAERLRRKGLAVKIFYRFHDAVYGDEEKLRSCRDELGTCEVDGPEWAPGYEPKAVLRMSPAKDRGLQLNITHGFRRM